MLAEVGADVRLPACGWLASPFTCLCSAWGCFEQTRPRWRQIPYLSSPSGVVGELDDLVLLVNWVYMSESLTINARGPMLQILDHADFDATVDSRPANVSCPRSCKKSINQLQTLPGWLKRASLCVRTECQMVSMALDKSSEIRVTYALPPMPSIQDRKSGGGSRWEQRWWSRSVERHTGLWEETTSVGHKKNIGLHIVAYIIISMQQLSLDQPIDKTGTTEIRRNSAGTTGYSTLGIGWTMAVYRWEVTWERLWFQL